MNPRRPIPHWVPSMRLVAITERKMVIGEEAFIQRCERLLSAGIRTLLFREKDLSARDQFRMCTALLPIVRRHRAMLIISDRLDVAIAVGADGAQLTGTSLSVGDARRLAPTGFLLGASCHGIGQLTEAEQGGADFAMLSPIFPPGSKVVPATLGIDELRRLAEGCAIPIIALGGITPARAAQCLRAGASGVAAIGALFGQDDPGEAVDSFLTSVEVTG
jgi:thiamine-phosphate diphosphorylase